MIVNAHAAKSRDSGKTKGSFFERESIHKMPTPNLVQLLNICEDEVEALRIQIEEIGEIIEHEDLQEQLCRQNSLKERARLIRYELGKRKF